MLRCTFACFDRIKIFHFTFEVSSRYVDNAEKELQNYVEKLPAEDPPPFPLEGRPTPSFTCRLFDTVLV